ncbi:MAG TPA: acyltransferase family protein [Actinospica sp.]|nr:acyltransferase family protein [Actinospica sp.]
MDELSSPPTPPQQRVSGLDGLRGLAVALVVLFHVYPGLLPGGFLGVDVFFVLSGYLITGVLVRGFAAAEHPRAWLRAFWLGRVRRLLPELATVLVAVCVVASCAAPEFGAGLRAQVAAAAVSGTNWLLVAHDQDYFAAFAADAGQPAAPALQHLWSLAVEEQFYVVWPLALWGLLRAAGARRDRYPALSLLLLTAAAGSFTLMAVNAGTGPSDYYNTLAHCGGLLLGAATALRLPMQRLTALDRPGDMAAAAACPSAPALATLRAGSLIPSAQWNERWNERWNEQWTEHWNERVPGRKLLLLGRCGLGGLIVLVVLAVCLRGDTGAPERGGILLASVATLPVLLAAACPSTDVARMLTWRPAAFLGVRSYGVYLWHWPLIMLLGTPASAAGIRAQMSRGVAELCLPVVLAGLSRRYVTLPARRLTRAQLIAVRDRLLGRTARPWPSRLTAGLATIALLPALVGLGRAPRVDPDRSALQEQISAGSAVAAASSAELTGPSATASRATTPGTGHETGLDHSRENGPGIGRAPNGVPDSAPIAVLRSGRLPPAGAPDPVLGGQISAIGDSVLLAGAEALADRLPGIVIDAKVGRQAGEAPDQLSVLAEEGRLRHFVIVALGTNGDFDDSLLDRIKAQIGPGRVLVLVTVHMPRSWQDPVNGRLAGYAAAHPGTVLVDWNATITPHPDLLWQDATHPKPSGGEVYADLMAYYLSRVHE